MLYSKKLSSMQAVDQQYDNNETLLDTNVSIKELFIEPILSRQLLEYLRGSFSKSTLDQDFVITQEIPEW